MRVRFTVIVVGVYEPLRVRRWNAAPAFLAALALAACGLQMPAGRGPVKVRVTSDFGAREVCSATVAHGAGISALALARRACKSFGASGRSRSGWSVYVDGVVASAGARVKPGELVWWDRHPPAARTAAVVGSFPEPFLHGLGGRRLPTAIACGAGMAVVCQRVASTLAHLGVPAATQALGGGSGQDSLTVEVGTWGELRGEVVATLLARGPGASGVFARFGGAPGGSLMLLDRRGATMTTLRRSAGLVAAVTEGRSPPTWIITGIDRNGVAAAARALRTGPLSDRFALAISGGHYLPLPR